MPLFRNAANVTASHDIYKHGGKIKDRDSVRKHCNAILSVTKEKHVNKLLEKFLNDPRAVAVFAPYKISMAELLQLRPIQISSIAAWQKWYKLLFVKSSNKINQFIKMRMSHDDRYCRGQYSLAKDVVDDAEASFGSSLWGTFSSIRLLCSMGKLVEAKEEVRKCSTNRLARDVCDRHFVKCQTESSDTFLEQLNNMLYELRTGGANRAADYFSFILLHPAYDKERNPLHIFRYISMLPLVDQYEQYKQIVSEILVDASKEDFKEIYDSVVSLSLCISDPELSLIVRNAKEVHYPKQTINILKQYTEGNYENCIKYIELMREESPSSTEFVEMFARCKAYINSQIEEDGSDLRKITKNFVDAITVQHKCYDKIKEIEAILIKNYPQKWTLPIFAQYFSLFNDLKNEQVAHSRAFQKYSGCGMTPRSNCTEFKLGNTMCYKITSDLFDKHGEKCSPKLGRALKYEIERCLESGKSPIGYDIIQDLIENSDHFLPYELDSVLVKIYLTNGEIEKALNVVAKCCIENIEAYRSFPFVKLTQLLACGNYSASIFKSIIYDVFNKKIAPSYVDELRDSYEDYMLSQNEYLPSVAFVRKGINHFDVYFLLNICQPHIMDISPEFGGSINVLFERIRVLDILINNADRQLLTYNVSDLHNEKFLLLESILVQQGRLKFETSKVYVDVDQIVKCASDDLHMLYGQYVIGNTESELETRELDPLQYIVSPKDAALWRIIDRFCTEFAKNPDYGLDKALSTEIRHGFISNLIRSRFHDAKLMTEMDEHNVYSDNLHWTTVYDYLTEDKKKALNLALAKFSASIDGVISEAKEWLKITFDPKDTNRVFNFHTDQSDVECCKNKFSECKDFSDAQNILINHCWEKLEFCIGEVHKRINENMKSTVFDAIKQLEDDISAVRLTAHFRELQRAIKKAKNGFVDDLKTLTSWLHATKEFEIPDQSFVSLIMIARDIFHSISFGKAVVFDLQIDQNAGEVVVDGKSCKALITSLVTAFNNALRHGVSSNSPCISLRLIVQAESYFELSITNQYKQQSNELPDSDLFSRINSIILSDKNESLMYSEGGSGLYKIAKLLKMSNESYAVSATSPSIGMFCLTISGVLQ